MVLVSSNYIILLHTSFFVLHFQIDLANNIINRDLYFYRNNVFPLIDESYSWKKQLKSVMEPTDLINQKNYYNRDKRNNLCDRKLHPTPPEEDKDKFQCLYILVEAAVALQQQEKQLTNDFVV